MIRAHPEIIQLSIGLVLILMASILGIIYLLTGNSILFQIITFSFSSYVFLLSAIYGLKLIFDNIQKKNLNKTKEFDELSYNPDEICNHPIEESGRKSCDCEIEYLEQQLGTITYLYINKSEAYSKYHNENRIE